MPLIDTSHTTPMPVRFFVNTRDARALDSTQQSIYGFTVERSGTD